MLKGNMRRRTRMTVILKYNIILKIKCHILVCDLIKDIHLFFFEILHGLYNVHIPERMTEIVEEDKVTLIYAKIYGNNTLIHIFEESVFIIYYLTHKILTTKIILHEINGKQSRIDEQILFLPLLFRDHGELTANLKLCFTHA